MKFSFILYLVVLGAVAVGIFQLVTTVIHNKNSTQQLSDAVEVYVPSLTGVVVDESNIISETVESELVTQLNEFNLVSGQRFLLLTVPAVYPYTPAEYSERVRDAWKLDEQTDILFLLVTESRVAWFDQSAESSAKVTAAESQIIIDTLVVPFIENDDWDAAAASGSATFLTELAL